MRPAHSRRIVDTRVLMRGMLLQLRRPLLGQVLHVVFASEVQTTGRTCFYTRGFQARAHAIRTQRAFVNLLRLGIELRNIERTTRDAILAADAMFLLKIDDAV